MTRDTMNIHWSFWLICIVALLWNLMGCLNFIIQMNADVVSSYRETEVAIILNRPLWATIAFAIAVFGGALGSILLMLKRPTAIHLCVVSLIGVVVAVLHSLTIEASLGIGELIGIVYMPLLLAVFLVWYAIHAYNKGWLQ